MPPGTPLASASLHASPPGPVADRTQSSSDIHQSKNAQIEIYTQENFDGFLDVLHWHELSAKDMKPEVHHWIDMFLQQNLEKIATAV